MIIIRSSNLVQNWKQLLGARPSHISGRVRVQLHASIHKHLLLAWRWIQWAAGGIWVDGNVDRNLEVILLLVDEAVVGDAEVEAFVCHHSN